ncbi:hypothetical protein EPIR_1752 [Erwinia piriflorinigrans CFBP 5888]|uniref:Uncharacterized protein n=1 Tax=Erwinia piriflorinigrans CFBP 5888 TaxID=1161919 RepID=V5Z713_9GAMM|nr:hypothetical protein EPIR_1752 [Erwinia piriflorinigrans CFBP 5888]
MVLFTLVYGFFASINLSGAIYADYPSILMKNSGVYSEWKS